ncbi:response regulator transcription factor [Acidithiobacillus ferriphilus]|jgi:Response regulator consisting of a CheY-like receiver domain and a Fis-type HTH domain|uniref:Two-component system response regulator n=2 Tax=Acidithiobacillus TaxID=119977 RepID=A0A179BLR4_ACIFR|nr:response regulator [Acidithiobacillus ferriphilus]OAP92245.1 two-component system response regulator [Acidithiobacillus ferrooxidans]MBU2831207.1 response regulator [Acidithiobacillus ferriphilus]MBU2834079.1 response regulator [Acidithiobacillus ferriphilus]MBU2855282.1 response regulator [Acidithiobacillus ferriphilus]MBW9249093.1 response regulator [Acidithiobacillus ferriphilus]
MSDGNTENSADIDTPSVSNIMVVDDDITFCRVLSTAFSRRGFRVCTVHDTADTITVAEKYLPDAVVLDLRMPGISGLELITPLRNIIPDIRILVLTGYASIATAIEAIKLGAVYYLTKPADADEIIARLNEHNGNPAAPVKNDLLSARRLEWEHISKVLMTCNGNISAAARCLGIHRRSLQRKLNKRPVRH